MREVESRIIPVEVKGRLLDEMNRVYEEEEAVGVSPSWVELVRRALVAYYLRSRENRICPYAPAHLKRLKEDRRLSPQAKVHNREKE